MKLVKYYGVFIARNKSKKRLQNRINETKKMNSYSVHGLNSKHGKGDIIRMKQIDSWEEYFCNIHLPEIIIFLRFGLN